VPVTFHIEGNIHVNVYNVAALGTFKFVPFKIYLSLLCISCDAFNFLAKVDLQMGMLPGYQSDCKLTFIS